LTLTGTDSEVEFSSIPATYRDLVIVISGTASAYTGMLVKANGSDANFSFVQMVGTGSGSGTSNANSTNDLGAVYTGQFVSTINIMDYSATDKHKTILARTNGSASDTRAVASRWASTNALTSFSFLISGAGTFSSGTTFALYGIAS
jgi:hypothetical protein